MQHKLATILKYEITYSYIKVLALYPCSSWTLAGWLNQKVDIVKCIKNQSCKVKRLSGGGRKVLNPELYVEIYVWLMDQRRLKN